MSHYTSEFIRSVEYGYDLDGGGYSFDEALKGHPLYPHKALLWEGPDLGYLGLCDATDEIPDLFAFRPCHTYMNDMEAFPDTFNTNEDKYVCVARGTFFQTDHDCSCSGKLVVWTGAAGEPIEPEGKARAWILVSENMAEIVESPDQLRLAMRGSTSDGAQIEDVDGHPVDFFWQCSGNVDDPAYPDCPRCEGDGFVESIGGEWALYVYAEEAEL